MAHRLYLMSFTTRTEPESFRAPRGYVSAQTSRDKEQPERILSALYLSLCVFTRVGLPWHRVGGSARLWVAAEAVIGWLSLGAFIAICVRLLSS